MDNGFNREPMLEIYITETSQMLEQLEQQTLSFEQSGFAAIDEIFRIMHSLKGSASMMLFTSIANLAHAQEDLFDYFRSVKPENIDYSKVVDIVLEGIDFFKDELLKIVNNFESDGDASILIEKIKSYLAEIRGLQESNNDKTSVRKENNQEEQKYYISSASNKIPSVQVKRYEARIIFDAECQAENVRAFMITHGLKELADQVETFPENILDNVESLEMIKQDGFKIFFNTKFSEEEIKAYFYKDPFVKEVELNPTEYKAVQNLPNKVEIILDEHETEYYSKQKIKEEIDKGAFINKQNAISVSVSKLDILMDLVGELVIAEAMVTRNPELEKIQLDGFHKAARHLRKISSELQDSVMSIRMVPLTAVFQKMNRIVRDMSHKLNKEVELELIGEETEVDKNIIENISDPIMHLIRNSMDHGIEKPDERIAKGKSAKGKITLEAKNSGGDVCITIKDDGRGLSREKILKKAKEKGLLTKSESEMSDKEVYSLIFLPGFSTKEAVSEFSGRGVGLDVVLKNIEKIRGSINIDYSPDNGTVVSIKIPLTLAIIEGMTIKVGDSRYTVPITSIRESFVVKEDSLITDPDGEEMLLLRGECYPIIRLHRLYNVKTKVINIQDGIIMMVEEAGKGICLFVDALIGEQQVVVKPLPKYIKKVRGVVGCTILGDGSISLILDAASLSDK